MPKLSAFPKCYMDDLCVTRAMTLFSRVAGLEDWRDCFDGMNNGNYVKTVLQPKA